MDTQNNFFRIAVCDDEALDREHIENMAKEVCSQEQIRAEITSFDSARQLLKEVEQGNGYDLLLLDVLMPEQTGMEFAEEMRRQNRNTSIVFVSNNREMALRGYMVSAVRYLAKPVDKELLREAIRYCFEKYYEESGIFLPYRKITRRVFPRDLIYVETNGRKCNMIQKDEEWEVGMNMTELEEVLSQRGFIRCHQSYLVNYIYIRTIGNNEIVLTDGKKIPVSKHRSKEVRERYFEIMNR